MSIELEHAIGCNVESQRPVLEKGRGRTNESNKSGGRSKKPKRLRNCQAWALIDGDLFIFWDGVVFFLFFLGGWLCFG